MMDIRRSTMMIRQANNADIDAIVEIYDEIITAEEKGLLSTGWIHGIYPTRKTAEEALERGDMYVLEDCGILASGVINQIQVDVYYGAPWEHDTDDVCVLHTLAVSTGASGRGYGRAFVEFYEQWAKEHGLMELRIDTNAINTAARALYRKMGYKEIDIVPTDFNGLPGIDLVLLEKHLDLEQNG